MTEQELNQIKEEVEQLKQALMDLEPVGTSLRLTGDTLVDQVSQRGLKRIVRRILAYPKTDTAKVVDDNEGALTHVIFEKLKVIQQQISIAQRLEVRLRMLQEQDQN